LFQPFFRKKIGPFDAEIEIFGLTPLCKSGTTVQTREDGFF
jgi:hypothetical protein